MTIAEARAIVLERQGGRCLARLLEADTLCRDQWGHAWWTGAAGAPAYTLELDRVREAASIGKAPSHADPTKCVLLCPGHHRGTGPAGTVWATSHRPELRAYLQEREP